jgi:hypothetical protein
MAACCNNVPVKISELFLVYRRRGNEITNVADHDDFLISADVYPQRLNI